MSANKFQWSLLMLYVGCMLFLAFGKGVIAPFPSFLAYATAHLSLLALVFRERKETRTDFAVVLTLAVLLRVAFFSYPLSDDVFRYAWEGKLIAGGGNPYVQAPLDYGEKFADDPIFQGINHKDMATVYPPVAQYIFCGISSISYSLSAYKMFFILCDIAIILLLIPMLRRWKRPLHWLALYALNPLVLLYGAGEGHVDVLQVLFIAAALLCFQRKRAASGFLLLGCAVMTKYLAAVAVPFVITRENRRYLPFLFAPLLLFAPFYQPQMFSSLMTFASDMHYNDVIPRLYRLVFHGNFYLPAMAITCGCGLGMIWMFCQRDLYRGIALGWMWVIFCLPCVHPWYFLPIALFLPAFPNRAWFTLSITIGFTFWVTHYQHLTGQWREFPWLLSAVYLPFALVALRDFFATYPESRQRHIPWQRKLPPVCKVDIIVPTLNEEGKLTRFLQSLYNAIENVDNDVNFEVYIADGGSRDATMEIAALFPLKMLVLEKGRGCQIAKGFAAGSGDLALILHADAQVNPDALCKLLKMLDKRPEIAWGILGHSYIDGEKMKWVERANRFRFHFLSMAFGDQGMFMRREVMENLGGIPQIRLMEDVEMSLRLCDSPRCSLGQSLRISARRWKSKKALAYTWQVMVFVLEYLLLRRLGADIRKTSDRMYARYYGQAAPLACQSKLL